MFLQRFGFYACRKQTLKLKFDPCSCVSLYHPRGLTPIVFHQVFGLCSPCSIVPCIPAVCHNAPASRRADIYISPIQDAASFAPLQRSIISAFSQEPGRWIPIWLEFYGYSIDDFISTSSKFPVTPEAKRLSWNKPLENFFFLIDEKLNPRTRVVIVVSVILSTPNLPRLCWLEIKHLRLMFKAHHGFFLRYLWWRDVLNVMLLPEHSGK